MESRVLLNVLIMLFVLVLSFSITPSPLANNAGVVTDVLSTSSTQLITLSENTTKVLTTKIPAIASTSNLISTSPTASIITEYLPTTTTPTPVVAPTISSKETFLAIVEAEIGTKESGPNNIKYNTWFYGKKVQAGINSSRYAWCAVFISWCADQAGISTTVIPKTASASTLAQHFNSLGTYAKYTYTYKPSVGDIIFIDWDKARGDIGTIDHVGIVIAIEGDKVITVEGNYADKVSCNTYLLTDRCITGYATPEYLN